jgi:hypothetical protein
MPTLNTNFTGSGIETTTPTVGPYGAGGGLGFLGLSPELSQLLKTRIATAQANANMGMRQAQNTEMGQGMKGVLGHRGSLGAATPDPELGRQQAAMQMKRQADQEARDAADNAQARQIMLARQAQDNEEKAHTPQTIRREGMTGKIIGVPQGTDENMYLQKLGYTGVRAQ